ncbi:hypothetical protein GCK32_006120 [Trichostrongylus colubriformis]|uniref:Uncharacterized protein n=1 Tax=Trichostrongylus colubriformis TaxID=6319 RepID=A0AAN8FSU9_TRICO
MLQLNFGCVALHSHLIIVLLVTHLELIFFIVVGGYENFSMFSGSQSSSTTEVLSSFEGLKLSVSLGLHAVATLCVFASVLMNNVNAISAALPPAVIIVILVFTFIFNAVGTILLYIFTPPKIRSGSTAILACAVLSSLTAVFTIGIIGAFIGIPPKKDDGSPGYGGAAEPPPPPN